ncbi:MAG: ABC transporter substrate-binding protein [Bacteroidota bacterium]|nr:ABC transporter substrate-binding protein [Bacteroidota bacterium]
MIGIKPSVAQSISDWTINIGLLIQDSSYTSVVRGAELAVSIANRKGGLNGRQFGLKVRSMEGPWGTGSKQAVDLIFKENVWALMGSHDGRNAHLVEQAATKSQVVFISAWSGDPTLSQAFVPWFFNCVPNDRQQAGSLIEEIYVKKKVSSACVVFESDYDSKLALDNFLKQVKQSGKPEPVQFKLDDFKGKTNALIETIKKRNAECLVLFCHTPVARELIAEIRRENYNIPLFGSVMLLNENELQVNKLKVYDDLLSVPSGSWPEAELKTFIQEYLEKYKRMPGMAACYSYDAANTLIEAIRIAGNNDRERIQKALSTINLKGVTGPVLFDSKGNRSGNFEATLIKNGLPATVK